jgi:hypothetical protein
MFLISTFARVLFVRVIISDSLHASVTTVLLAPRWDDHRRIWTSEVAYLRTIP